MSEAPPFSRDLLRFLAELKTHNRRAWFESQRPRYERVYRQAFARFIEEFGPRLATISPYFVADSRPTGGSVMRIYRDIRFTKDKSPYRTYTVVHFPHRDAGEGRAPGFFLYVAPDEISGGGGIWHPEPAVANRIRAAIARDPNRWSAAVSSPAFLRRFTWTGESLQRPPAGFPKDHPMAEDLRRKDFVASTTIPASKFVSRGFVEEYAELCRTVAPLVEFLSGATGVRF